MSRDILSRPAPPAHERVKYGPAPLQFGDMRVPDGPGPHPLVIVVHGGFWRGRYDLTHAGHLCSALTDAGLATWNIEYRRIGDEGGGWTGTFQDVGMAADHVRKLKDSFSLDLNRVIALGHSAGGHLALWLAARHRLKAGSALYRPDPMIPTGAVALAGIPDLLQAWDLKLGDGVVEAFLGGTPSMHPERFADASPITQLPLGLPQVLIHGSDDRTVPYATSERYVERAMTAGDTVSLVRLERTGHFELIDPRSEQWPVVEHAVRLLS